MPVSIERLSDGIQTWPTLASKAAVRFLIGLFLIWVVVASPRASLDHHLLTVHMLEHLLLMMPAPPLIWLGAPGGPVYKL